MANNEIAIIQTGIRLELPTGYVGLVHSRSGFAKKGIIVANAPGVIDAGYRGEIGVILMNLSGWPIGIYKGDRIAQLIIQKLPKIKLQLVNAKDFNASDTTERGTAGFGSTGNC